MREVGVVGTGHLGRAIAVTLARSGSRPAVYDVSRDALDGLDALGCVIQPSVELLAAEVPIVLVIVGDDDQLQQVISEVLGARSRQEVVLVHSTVSPDGVRRASSRLAERGIPLLDAPVTGGVPAAERSMLTCLVGGERIVLDRAMPVLRAYCHRIVPVGEVGAGQVAKLVNNVMSIMNTLVALEALSIAEAAGLDVEALRKIVADGGTGGSRALAGTDADGFGTPWADRAASLQRGKWAGDERQAPKDLRLAQDLAEELGVITALLPTAIGRRQNGAGIL